MSLRDTLEASIRTIPDYPKRGVMFRDITTLLGDARAFRRSIDELVHPYAGTKIDKIAGVEARGFILGGAMSHQLSAGFVPVAWYQRWWSGYERCQYSLIVVLAVAFLWSLHTWNLMGYKLP